MLLEEKQWRTFLHTLTRYETPRGHYCSRETICHGAVTDADGDCKLGGLYPTRESIVMEWKFLRIPEQS
jgi:hypothetical protein